ncbi:Pyrimidine 5'-nucleotidase YjjG [Bordetella ansorpii]|uniref:Pyrimidine 5'-nucleotidase YjjG n=1 Tax=Bordetella ansorpii TaxID=288768 RepID=A0A157SVY6_9BORD|nr:HAD family hydrolase [Bordetella ansorpii]SAI74628.1 Pyrimidine 5'-nucleotidase YjjG [Bordetella ansorpii]
MHERLKNVSAISLDLDDTLWPFAPIVAHAETRLHAWLLENAPRTAAIVATPQSLAQLRNDYEAANPALSGNYRALRLGSIQAALEAAQEDVALVQPAYDAFYAARQEVQFFEDAFPALQWLSARFPLVAVSNGNARLDMTGGHQFFTGAISAADAGIAKPEAAIFHAAADMVSARPEQMLHVGDNFELDVVGARNAGLQAAWLVRQDQGLPPRMEYSDHMTVSCLLTLCAALGRTE